MLELQLSDKDWVSPWRRKCPTFLIAFSSDNCSPLVRYREETALSRSWFRKQTNKQKQIKLQFPEEPKEPTQQLLETVDLITQTSQLLWKTKPFSPWWMVMTELQNLLLKRRRTFSYPEWKLGELKATTEGSSETWSTTHKTRLPCP